MSDTTTDTPTLIFRNLLPADFHARLRAMVHRAEGLLIRSGVVGDDPSYRRSRVMRKPDDPEDAACLRDFLQFMQGFLPGHMQALDVEPFEQSGLELQMTASGDGDYFLPHIDNDKASQYRRVSFVYYLVNTPGCFTGGELRVFPFQGTGAARRPSRAGAQEIAPEDNMLAMFPSHYVHQVMKVSVPSRQFIDSRFTLNGWVLGPVPRDLETPAPPLPAA